MLPIDKMIKDAEALELQFIDGTNTIRDKLTADVVCHVKAMAAEIEKWREDRDGRARQKSELLAEIERLRQERKACAEAMDQEHERALKAEAELETQGWRDSSCAEDELRQSICAAIVDMDQTQGEAWETVRHELLKLVGESALEDYAASKLPPWTVRLRPSGGYDLFDGEGNKVGAYETAKAAAMYHASALAEVRRLRDELENKEIE